MAKTEIQNLVQTFKPTFMCIQNLMTLSMPVKLEKRDQEEYLLYGTKETFQCRRFKYMIMFYKWKGN